LIEGDRTLRYLERVVRARPVERALCCPSCSGEVVLRAGAYSCAACGEGFGSASADSGPAGLARLAVVETAQGA
jgi:uncharacterized protein (DUF983 family)